MRISVLLPSLGSAEGLERCFEALATQSLAPDAYEVLYCTADAASTRIPRNFRHISARGRGLAPRRNLLVNEARGDVLLFLGDDTVPMPTCLEAHAEAHRVLAEKPALVIGGSAAVVRLPDRLLDRVARETPLVNALSQMEKHGTSVERDWTFRSTLLLNASVRACACAGERFDESPQSAEYSTLEWAWRITSVNSLPVVFRPGARVRHDWRFEPDAFLDLEMERGAQAYHAALRFPRFAKALFGRDVRDADELRYSRAFVESERALAEQLRQEFFALADVNAHSATPQAVDSIFKEQSLLKRWTWRLGLIAAAATPAAALPLAA